MRGATRCSRTTAPKTQRDGVLGAGRARARLLRGAARAIERDFPGLRWPLEYRTLAADDLWLSTASGRATATISVHQGVDASDEPLFRACEEIFAAHEGRPHWGKVHYRTGAELASLYPRWGDWWNARDRYDPDGLFLNPYLSSLRP